VIRGERERKETERKSEENKQGGKEREEKRREERREEKKREEKRKRREREEKEKRKAKKYRKTDSTLAGTHRARPDDSPPMAVHRVVASPVVCLHASVSKNVPARSIVVLGKRLWEMDAGRVSAVRRLLQRAVSVGLTTHAQVRRHGDGALSGHCLASTVVVAEHLTMV
jgi:flagellar biosynthesis GTPase FlhF